MSYADLYFQSKRFCKIANVNPNGLDKSIYSYLVTKTPGKITPEAINSFFDANKTVLHQLRFIEWDQIGDHLFGIDDDSNKFKLSTQPSPPQNKHVKQSYILRGIQPIPTLFAYQYEDANTDFPKELGHYLFLMTAISNMFGYGEMTYFYDTPKRMDDFVKFVQENKGKLDSIRSRFQYEPKPLGGGSDGFVFAIGKDRILKIFQQQFSYDAAKESADRIWKQHGIAATEAYIDDIGKIGNFEEHPVYYYIQERMQTAFNFFDKNHRRMDQLSFFMKDIAKTIKSDPNYEAIRKNRNHPRIGNAIKSLAERVYNRIVYFVNEEITGAFDGKLQPDWMIKLIEEMAGKIITDRIDLRSYNAGITANGYLRFFDPAFDPKELNQEHLL
jgi:hypothetical protein